MKKLLLLLLPLYGVFAQTTNIKPGVYKSNSMGANFIMRLNEDNTYELVFLHGNYVKEGDTLRLNVNRSTDSNFMVTPVTRDKNASSLTITFDSMASYYMFSGLYIGTQHNDSRPPEYKSIREYIDRDEFNYTEDQPVSFKLDKTKYLYFVNYRNYYNVKRNTKPTLISKFEIPDDVSEIKVEMDYNEMGELNFKMYKNEKDEVMMSESSSRKAFVFKELGHFDNAGEKLPAQVTEDMDFGKNAGIVADIDVLEEETISEEAPSYTFKYKIDKTLAEAQKTAAKSKNRFLVVAFDYENKNSQADFDKFIKRTEIQVGYNMSEEYVESEDHFSFYLASDKDKNLLSKNSLDAKKPQILVFNSDGDLIYHTSATLKKSGYFNSYNSAYNDLQQANQYLKFDRSVSNKKITVPELTKVFKVTGALSRPFNNVAVDTTVTVAPYDNEIEVTETIAVDTTVVEVYSDYSREGVITDIENLYKLKTSVEAVKSKWAQIIAYYKKANAYDQDFIDTGLSELADDGFSSRLFTQGEWKSDDSKFDFLDYVYAHLQEIRKSEETFNRDEELDLHYLGNDVDSVLGLFFSNYANSESEDKTQTDKIRQYYKKYIALSGENLASLRSYFYFVQNTLSQETEREYLNVYGRFFDSVIKPDLSVIENLDRVYSEDFKENYDTWAGFKDEFASTANTVAWYVVEHKLEKSDIQKAIKWSETSLKIEQKNAYFLDTLGQLYYLNGQKEKAIATEQLAVTAASELEDPETKLKYEEVLQKMKNGTY